MNRTCTSVIAALQLTVSLLAASGAEAVSVSRTRTVLAEFRVDGAVHGLPSSMSVGPVSLQPIPGPPAPDDFLQAGVTPPAYMVWPGSAYANYVTAGFTTIEIEGRRTDSTGTQPFELRALIEESTFGGNEFPEARPLSFAFHLTDMAITLNNPGNAWGDNPFLGPSDAVGAQIWYEVLLDGDLRYRGGTTLYFHDHMALRADGVAGAIYDATNIAGDVTWGSAFIVDAFTGTPGSSPRTAIYFDRIIPELYLGMIDPFETWTVTARLGAALIMPPFAMDAGGRITVGDPSGVSLGDLGTPSLGSPAAPVPLPPAAWMLGGALAGLALLRRRRSTP